MRRVRFLVYFLNRDLIAPGTVTAFRFRFKQGFVILAMILFCVTPARAEIRDRRAYGPLSTRTQNPLLLQFLNLSLESPQTLNRGQSVSEVQTTYSNLFEFGARGTTRINMDMELWRTVFAQEYGLAEGIDLRVEMPFTTSSGGFFDAALQAYHKTFGFPNGGRERVADNQYGFTFSRGGRTFFDHPASTFGPGDLTLRAKWLVPRRIINLPLGIKIAVVPSVKFPTGRATRGLSSGRFDFGLGLLAEKALGRFRLVTQAGGVFLGGHRDIGSLINRAFLQFGQSAEFQILDGWAAILQLTGGSAVFKNADVRPLRGPALDLTGGFAGSFPFRRGFCDEFYYEFAFTEDIASTGPSVDFSTLFTVGLRY